MNFLPNEDSKESNYGHILPHGVRIDKHEIVTKPHKRSGSYYERFFLCLELFIKVWYPSDIIHGKGRNGKNGERAAIMCVSMCNPVPGKVADNRARAANLDDHNGNIVSPIYKECIDHNLARCLLTLSTLWMSMMLDKSVSASF